MLSKALTRSVALAACLFLATGMASATTIGFDEFVNDGPNGGEVDGTEWLGFGMLFETPDLQLNLGSTTGSSPNSLGADINNNDFNGSVVGTVVDGFVTDLTLIIFNFPFQVSAFDVNGDLVHTIASNNVDFEQLFDFTGFEVHRFVTTGTFYAIDDVTFGQVFAQPIPEPASMALMGIGLAGLAARARRKRTQA